MGQCKNCQHGCHCSNGSSCSSCGCHNCQHEEKEESLTDSWKKDLTKQGLINNQCQKKKV